MYEFCLFSGTIVDGAARNADANSQVSSLKALKVGRSHLSSRVATAGPPRGNTPLFVWGV